MLKKSEKDFSCGITEPPDIDHVKKLIFHHLMIFQGRDPKLVGDRDMYKALSYTPRDVLIKNWIKTQRNNYDRKRKRIYYLSLEFLIGRSLGNTLINLGFYDEAAEALKALGCDLDVIREMEEEAALGNGGLGRQIYITLLQHSNTT